MPSRPQIVVLMRRACAQTMLAGQLGEEFRIEHHWRRAGNADEGESAEYVAAAAIPSSFGHAELAARIVEWLACEHQIDPASVSIYQPFTDFGLDSFLVVSLIDFLERQLGTALDSGMLSEHRNIDELRRHLAERHARVAAVAANRPPIGGSARRKIG